MGLEQQLARWSGPSSDTEQEKQERTLRMIKQAVSAHVPFSQCRLRVYAKGSYANNTNVRTDSDVDIAVQCSDCVFYKESTPGCYAATSTYEGPWGPARLRTELQRALEATFPGQVSTEGATAISIRSSSARVDADVVPCFDYRYHWSQNEYREGVRVFKKNGTPFENYPVQQLENGRRKNVRTGHRYKQAVRILKRVENSMVSARLHQELPSYFVECLVYYCPDNLFAGDSWVAIVQGILGHILITLQGDEPSEDAERWLEVNECKYLFHPDQKWTREDARSFAASAMRHLGFVG